MKIRYTFKPTHDSQLGLQKGLFYYKHAENYGMKTSSEEAKSYVDTIC
jgi:hypothetical protein